MALAPQPRKDRGLAQQVDEATRQLICDVRREHPCLALLHEASQTATAHYNTIIMGISLGPFYPFAGEPLSELQLETTEFQRVLQVLRLLSQLP